MNTNISLSNPILRPRRAVFWLAILVLVIATGCGAASPQPQTQPTQGVAASAPTPTASETANPSPTPVTPEPTAASAGLAPAGWTAHSSQRCEYALSFPAEMVVTSDTAYSSTFKYNLDNLQEATPNFIYISVIDQEFLSLNPEDVYNYAPAEADRLINLQVGESSPLTDFEQMAEWITYQRLPDTTINGLTVQAYENVKPWEFPEGTKEIRYYLSLDGCMYQIGGYLDTTQSDKPGAIPEDLFHQIVDTFQAMP